MAKKKKGTLKTRTFNGKKYALWHRGLTKKKALDTKKKIKAKKNRARVVKSYDVYTRSGTRG